MARQKKSWTRARLTMPFIHTVIVKFIRPLTVQEADSITAAAVAMTDTILEIKSLKCGCDAGINGPERMSFSLTAEFESADAYRSYSQNVHHRNFIAAHITPVLAENGRVAIQYQV